MSNLFNIFDSSQRVTTNYDKLKSLTSKQRGLNRLKTTSIIGSVNKALYNEVIPKFAEVK